MFAMSFGVGFQVPKWVANTKTLLGLFHLPYVAWFLNFGWIEWLVRSSQHPHEV
jgi:hypothetical protein